MDRRPEGNAIEQSGLFASAAPVPQLKPSRSVPLSLGRIIRCRLAVVRYRGATIGRKPPSSWPPFTLSVRSKCLVFGLWAGVKSRAPDLGDANMPSSQDGRSGYDFILMITSATTRSLLLCQITRSNVESDEPRGIVRRRPQPGNGVLTCPQRRAALVHCI